MGVQGHPETVLDYITVFGNFLFFLGLLCVFLYYIIRLCRAIYHANKTYSADELHAYLLRYKLKKVKKDLIAQEKKEVLRQRNIRYRKRHGQNANAKTRVISTSLATTSESALDKQTLNVKPSQKECRSTGLNEVNIHMDVEESTAYFDFENTKDCTNNNNNNNYSNSDTDTSTSTNANTKTNYIENNNNNNNNNNNSNDSNNNNNNNSNDNSNNDSDNNIKLLPPSSSDRLKNISFSSLDEFYKKHHLDTRDELDDKMNPSFTTVDVNSLMIDCPFCQTKLSVDVFENHVPICLKNITHCMGSSV
eukprot:Awhi_evm1s15117